MDRRNLFRLSAAGALGLLGAPANAQGTASSGLLSVKVVKGMGRGVFATRAIRSGAIVLRNHCLRLSSDEKAVLEKSLLKDYYFEDFDDGTAYLAMGMASFLNHSFLRPNVEQDWDGEGDEIVLVFTAIRNIAAGEQLFFDYEFVEGDIPAWADNPRK